MKKILLMLLIPGMANAINYTLFNTSNTTTSGQSSYTTVKTGYYQFDVRISSAYNSPSMTIGVQELGKQSSENLMISSYTTLSNVTAITTRGLYTFPSDIIVGGDLRVNYAISAGTFTFTVTAREITP